MSYTQSHPLFRSLTDDECREFEDYARTTDPEADWHILHPVCRRIWQERGVEQCGTDYCLDCITAYRGLEPRA